MDPKVRAYMSAIGRRGGQSSRRRLTPEQARNMVRVREARRAYKTFYARCFWSYDPNYVVTSKDVDWVAKQLMKLGGRGAWEVGGKLCR